MSGAGTAVASPCRYSAICFMLGLHSLHHLMYAMNAIQASARFQASVPLQICELVGVHYEGLAVVFGDHVEDDAGDDEQQSDDDQHDGADQCRGHPALCGQRHECAEVGGEVADFGSKRRFTTTISSDTKRRGWKLASIPSQGLMPSARQSIPSSRDGDMAFRIPAVSPGQWTTPS